MQEATDITVLKTLYGGGTPADPAAYLFGHDTPGDGGQGTFYWDSTSTATDDNGTIIENTSYPTGRWLREISGPINVRWFGAKPDFNTSTWSGTDNSSIFATATLLALTLNIYKIYIPAGAYGLTSYTMTTCSVVGDGPNATFIYALATSVPSFWALEDSMVAIDYISKLQFTDFTLAANPTSPNAGQHGMYLYVIDDPSIPSTGSGGVWFTEFNRLEISGFAGHQLHIEASTTTFPSANQFLTFEHVDCYRSNLAAYWTTSLCLYTTGETGQIIYNNCVFDGLSSGDEADTSSVNIEFDLVGTFSANHQLFIDCTIQNAHTGVSANQAKGIEMYKCWFENLYYATTWTNQSTATIQSCRFANIGGTASKPGGYLVSNNDSNINFIFNEIKSAYTNSIVCTDQVGGLIHGNFYNTPSNITIFSSGVCIPATISGLGVLNVYNNRDIVINGTTAPPPPTPPPLPPLKTITSQLFTGEQLRIKMIDSPPINSYMEIVDTGNITLPTWANGKVILRSNDVACFTLQDDVNEWVLDSVSYYRRETDTLPTMGTWFAGEILYRTTPIIGEGIGWVCTTGGSSPVWTQFGTVDALPINVTSATQPLVVNNIYIANDTVLVVFTLPATAAVGDTIEVIGQGTGGWKVTENTGQIINSAFGSTTVSTGSIASTNQYDAVKLICVVANTTFQITSLVGTLTIV